MKRLKRNDRRVAGPRNMHDPSGANRIAASDRKPFDRGALCLLKLIEEGANACKPGA